MEGNEGESHFSRPGMIPLYDDEALRCLHQPCCLCLVALVPIIPTYLT